MRFYDVGESPLMGHSEKHIPPLVLGGLIAAGASLVGNATGASSQNKTNQTSIGLNRENNAFNAEQAQIQRDWQEKMWGMNNSYNSPNAMISRGLNPFVQGSAAMAGSRSPASGGAAASAASAPSLQAFRPDFSDVGSALASMAQARASMIKSYRTVSSINLRNKYRIQLLRTNFHRLIRPSTAGSQYLPTVKRSSPRLISSTSTESSMDGINIRFPLPIAKIIA